MEGLIAILVTALDARSHSLVADIAGQSPSILWYFFDLHDGFHESVISQRDLRNPHGAKKMRPLG
jgi:hypothetical protein